MIITPDCWDTDPPEAPDDAPGRGFGTKTPIIAVITPATNIIPPRTKYTMSVTQARTFSDKMVPRHDEKADSVTRGPKITMPIPTKKMTGRIGFESS
jgi:hypothetical protein